MCFAPYCNCEGGIEMADGASVGATDDFSVLEV